MNVRRSCDDIEIIVGAGALLGVVTTFVVVGVVLTLEGVQPWLNGATARFLSDVVWLPVHVGGALLGGVLAFLIPRQRRRVAMAAWLGALIGLYFGIAAWAWIGLLQVLRHPALTYGADFSALVGVMLGLALGVRQRRKLLRLVVVAVIGAITLYGVLFVTSVIAFVAGGEYGREHVTISLAVSSPILLVGALVAYFVASRMS